MEKKNAVAIAMEKKDMLASINPSDPLAMEKKKAVDITMEKKDVVASVPAIDGAKAPADPAADRLQAPIVPDCKIPFDWVPYEERPYSPPPNPYDTSIIDEYPEVTTRV
jgi:hypothetical protein